MANQDWDDDLDDNENDGSPLVKDLRRQLKAANKAKADLEKQLGDVSKTVRQREVKDVLAAKNVNPKIARFILQDLEDPTEESVATWLEENGEIFGVKASSGAEGEPVTQAAPKGMSAEDLKALNAINTFADSTTAGGASRTDELQAAIESAGSVDEVLGLIGNWGTGVTPFHG